MYEDLKEYLNWYDTRMDTKFAADAPVIGLVLQRSHLVTGDEGHYSGVVSELEAQGAKVLPLLFPLPALLLPQLQKPKLSTAASAVHLYVVLLCALLPQESIIWAVYLFFVAFLVLRIAWQSCCACNAPRRGVKGGNGQLSMRCTWHCMAEPCTSCFTADC